MRNTSTCACGSFKSERARKCLKCAYNVKYYETTFWNAYEIGEPTCSHKNCIKYFEKIIKPSLL